MWGEIIMRRTAPFALVLVVVLGACGGGSGSLQNVVIPAPPDFVQSQEHDAKNGAMSKAEFDDYIREPDIAAQTHLKAAYQATYDSKLNDDSILIVVADFGSVGDAATFAALSEREGPFRASRGDPALSPKLATV